jgi:hypothetical protein
LDVALGERVSALRSASCFALLQPAEASTNMAHPAANAAGLVMPRNVQEGLCRASMLAFGGDRSAAVASRRQ